MNTVTVRDPGTFAQLLLMDQIHDFGENTKRNALSNQEKVRVLQQMAMSTGVRSEVNNIYATAKDILRQSTGRDETSVEELFDEVSQANNVYCSGFSFFLQHFLRGVENVSKQYTTDWRELNIVVDADKSRFKVSPLLNALCDTVMGKSTVAHKIRLVHTLASDYDRAPRSSVATLILKLARIRSRKLEQLAKQVEAVPNRRAFKRERFKLKQDYFDVKSKRVYVSKDDAVPQKDYVVNDPNGRVMIHFRLASRYNFLFEVDQSTDVEAYVKSNVKKLSSSQKEFVYDTLFERILESDNDIVSIESLTRGLNVATKTEFTAKRYTPEIVNKVVRLIQMWTTALGDLRVDDMSKRKVKCTIIQWFGLTDFADVEAFLYRNGDVVNLSLNHLTTEMKTFGQTYGWNHAHKFMAYKTIGDLAQIMEARALMSRAKPVVFLSFDRMCAYISAYLGNYTLYESQSDDNLGFITTFLSEPEKRVFTQLSEDEQQTIGAMVSGFTVDTSPSRFTLSPGERSIAPFSPMSHTPSSMKTRTPGFSPGFVSPSQNDIDSLLKEESPFG